MRLQLSISLRVNQLLMLVYILPFVSMIFDPGTLV